jgi:hypothetical protein
MKKPLVLISFAALLSNCSHQTAANAPVASGRYAELAGQPTKSPKHYRVTLNFEGKGEAANQSPALVVRPGQTAKIEAIREFIYPSDYGLAEASAVKLPVASPGKAGASAVTPSTPKNFVTKNLGYTGEVSVRPQGAFVVIKGMLAYEKFAGFSRAPGEAISPLVEARNGKLITDNRVDLPNFIRSETPLYIAGLPGVPHTIDLPGVPGKVTVTCTPID